MAVTFDAVGPSSSGAFGTASPYTWSHTCGAGATLLLVSISVDNAASSGTTTAATYGGVAMTSLKRWISGGSSKTAGFTELWYLFSPAAGAGTVQVTWSAGDASTAGSVSFDGAVTLGTPVTGDSAGNTETSGSISVPTASASNMVAGFVTNGSGGTAFTSGTSRWFINGGGGGAATSSAGDTVPATGSPVTVAWTQADDWYAAIGVEVQGGAGGPVIRALVRAPAQAPQALQQIPPRVIPALSGPHAAQPADAAGGADAIAVTVTVPLADSGAGEEYEADDGMRQDCGAGADALSVAAAVPLGDAGGAEEWSDADGSRDDAAGGADSLSVTVAGAAPLPVIRAPVRPPPVPQPVAPQVITLPPPCITGLAGGGTGYFTDQYGRPRLLLADNPWGLPCNAGAWNSGDWQADYDGYCNARGAQGFTAVYTDPLGNTADGGSYNNGNTWDDVAPFTSGGDPSSGLNSAFWERIDYFISSCARNGLTAWLNIANVEYDTFMGSWTGTQWTAWGTALAARYAAVPNIIWTVGNDYYDSNDTQIGDMITALRAGGDSHVLLVHNYIETDSRYGFGSDNSGDVLALGTADSQASMVYTYIPTYFGVEYAYTEPSPIPVFWGDGYFYGGSGAQFDTGSRQMAWWALASGARGANTGSEFIWEWGSGALAEVTEGAWWTTQAGAARALIESLPGWTSLLPDTSSELVTGGRGTRTGPTTSGGSGEQYGDATTDDYIAASRVSDGSLAVIYFSAGCGSSTITIDQTKMQSGYTATWVDPATGAQYAGTPGSTYSAGTARGNNAAGYADWVLVLQGPAVPAPAVSDCGAAADALQVSVTIPLADAGAGEEYQASDGMRQDCAGAAEALSVTVTLALADAAGSAEYEAPDGMRVDAAAAADAIAVTVTSIAPAVIQAPAAPPAAPRAPPAQVITGPSPAVPVALADAAAAAEWAYADGSRTDCGGADDTLAIAVSIPLADAAGAGDYGAPDGMRQDQGGAADALSLAASVPLGDAAGASEWSWADGSRDDAAGAAEALAASVTVPLGDAGAALDVFNAGNPYVYELGAAADGLVTQVTSAPPAVIAGPAPLPPPLPAIAPQVIGGLVTAPVPVALADAAAAAEWQHADGSRADSAAGADAITATVAVPLADIAAAAEVTPVTVPDSAGASDSLAVATGPGWPDAAGAADQVTADVTGAGWADSTGASEAFTALSSTADTGHVRWAAHLYRPRWHVTLYRPRWEARLMGPNAIAASSLEFLNMLWTAELAGTEIDPTGQTSGEPQLTVQFAMPLSSGDPLAPAEPSDWFSADWLTGTNIRGYVCQGLLGPSPAPFQMTAGQLYDAWSQILGTPEAPRKFCGTVTAF